jgi:integrase
MKNQPTKVRGVFERPKDSGRWWIRYHDERGREHREFVGPRGLAIQVYQKRKTEIRERRFFPERIQRREVTVADMVGDHLAREKGKARSYKDMARFGRNWTRVLGAKTLRQVVPGDVERYAAKRREVVSEQTVAHELSFLRRVFNVAIRDTLADVNPVKGLVPTPRNERVRYLTEAEESELISVLDARAQDLVRFAIHTGLRQGEHFGLRWEWVDLQNSVLRIPTSKSGKPRTVPLNDVAREILRLQPRRLRCPWVWPTSSPKGGATPGRNHINARNFERRVFVPALQAAGIENFRWHDLRHTFASRLAMAGETLQTIAQLLGHASVQMAQRYSHLSPGHLRAAVQRLVSKATGTRTGTKKRQSEKS